VAVLPIASNACVRLADQSLSGVAGRVKAWAGDILERGGVDDNEVLMGFGSTMYLRIMAAVVDAAA
jgi:hypothetical protein